MTTLHKLLLVLVTITAIIGLTACTKKPTEYPFLESFVIDTLVENQDETTVCDTYGHHFDNAIEATCSSFYTEVIALNSLIDNPSNIHYEATYEAQASDIVKTTITITEHNTSYSIDITFRDKN